MDVPVQNVKYISIIKYIHKSINIWMALSLFLSDYNYLSYNIIVCILMLLGWLFNTECVLIEYEKYIERTYDKVKKEHNKCNKCTRSFTFHVSDRYKYKIYSPIIYILISLLRICFKYNFITFQSPFYKSLMITVLMIVLLLLFIILLIPAIRYHNKYKNNKQMIIYLSFFIIIVCISFYYLLFQE